jgi:PAS domain S-box-containing protein
MENNAQSPDLVHRLAQAEAILDALGRGEADVIVARDGLNYVHSKEHYDRDKRAELALRQSQRRLRLALESAYVIAFEWDIRRDEVRRDVSSDPVLDATKQDAPSSFEAVCEVVHPDDRALFRANVAAALARPDGRYASEFRIVHPDGRIVWLSESGLVEKDDEGLPLRLFGVSQDVTARKQVDEALQLSAEKFRAFFHSDAFGAAMLTLDGHFIKVNDTLCRMTGYAEDELLRLPPSALTHPEDWATQSDDYAAYLTGKFSPYRVEKRYLCKDGRTIWVQVTASLVRDEMGRPLYSAGTIHDITESKRVEDELKIATATAERANHAKSRFLAAASHDLRQPLAALRLYVDVLKAKVAPEQQSLVASIEDCIVGLGGLLGNLLDLSKLDAQAVKPQIVDFSVADFMSRLESVYAPEAQGQGLRLRFRPSPLSAHSDPALLQRIVGNFIANAIRYTVSGRVVVSCRRRQGKTWIEVWDTGIGFSTDKTAEIFEEFRQLDGGARNGGSGLGLAIAARTAALLDLKIRVRSKPGHGSVFAVELPLAQQKAVAAAPKSDAVHCALRVALVEDNFLVRAALVMALQNLGHRVVAAADGKSLLAELGNSPPDIVVTDYRLADGETGYDVIAALRAAMNPDLPAVLITGDTDPTLIAGMASRDIAVLHKPIDLIDLQTYLAALSGAH